MKILLRSLFKALPDDDEKLLLKNFRMFDHAGLGFDQPEDNRIYAYIKDFVSRDPYVPSYESIKDEFTNRHPDMEVEDRLQILLQATPIVRGDFIQRLETKNKERKNRIMQEIFLTATTITQTGLEVGKGRDKKTLEGPEDAVRYILGESHKIVTPTLGAKLSGEITHDGDDFFKRYLETKNSTRITHNTGIKQIDDALHGARAKELWTHAAFTGHLKCVQGSSRVFDIDQGLLTTVAALYHEGRLPTLHTLNENTWEMQTVTANALSQSGIRRILEIKTTTGRTLGVTGNHPIMTSKGWVDAKDLTENDWVAVPDRLQSYPSETHLAENEAVLLGYLLGDGSMKYQLGFTNSNKEILEDFIRNLQEIGYSEKDSKQSSKITYRTYPKDSTTQISISQSSGTVRNAPWVSPLRVLLGRLGLWGCTAGDKFIPSEIWGLKESSIWKFISALWSTDGTVGTLVRQREGRQDTTQVNVSYTSKSERLCRDLQLLLQKIGVPSSICVVAVDYKGEKRPFWYVNVTSSEGLSW